jgi:hypothetical protein
MKPAAGLRALLERIIDYAGLFPPAKLPLDEAIKNYARYRRDAEAWMLGRFVIPASRLEELQPYGPLFAEGLPFAFSALGRGGGSASAFLDGLRDDLQAIGAFEKRHSSRVVTDVLEVKWPNVSPAETMGLFESVADCIEQHPGPLTLTPYFEVGLGGDWRRTVAAFVTGLKHFREDRTFRRRTKCRPPGLKLRCGGLDAAAFPSPEQIAFVLHCCLTHRVPLKCTAGLHHPLRHHNDEVETKMHGFLNVFGAGVLGQALGLDEAKLRAILEDEDTVHFVCDKHGFAWQDWHATAPEVVFARHAAVTSFGSCSFDEPCDDLRALGWLPDPHAVPVAPEIGGEGG